MIFLDQRDVNSLMDSGYAVLSAARRQKKCLIIYLESNDITERIVEMSHTELKAGLRALIPSLDGASKDTALLYFMPILGEPFEIERWNGVVEYFRYTGEFVPIYDSETQRWFIDFIELHDDAQDASDHVSISISVENINQLSSRMKDVFTEVEDVLFFVYTWYNGSDEPVYFPVN